MIYVGIDPSYSPTIAIMKDNFIMFKVAHNPLSNHTTYRSKFNRIANTGKGVYEILKNYASLKGNQRRQMVVGLEQVSYGEKFGVALSGAIEFSILQYLFNNPLVKEVITVAPATWKKTISGNGRATKLQVAEILKEAYSLTTNNLNCSDALAILLTAKMKHEQRDY